MDRVEDGGDGGLQPSRDQLLEHLHRAYGVPATAVQALAMGADPHAATYRVDGPNSAWFLKLHASTWNNISVLVAHQLGGVGGLRHVPAPLPCLDGRLVTRLLGSRVVLWPFVDGRSGFDTPLPAQGWPQLGALLRAVHDTQVPRATRSRLRVEGFHPRWRRAVQRRYRVLDSTVVQDATAAELIDLLRQRRDRILGLVDCAEALAAQLRSDPRELVLCHGDLHAGNVLIGPAGQLAFIDWDSTLLAPRERDLMFPGAGIGGAWSEQVEARAFLGGYLGADAGRIVPDAAAVAYYRCERIVEDVAVTCTELLTGPHNAAARRRMLRQLHDQFEPGNVVDLAERTVAAPSLRGHRAGGAAGRVNLR